MPDILSDRHVAPLRSLRPVSATAGGAHLREGIGLRDVLRILRRRIWIVAAVTVAVTAATGYFVQRAYPFYRATSTLRLENIRQSMTSGLSGPEGPTHNERVINPQLSRIQLLMSRSLIGAVVDSLGLRFRPDFHNFAARLLVDVQVTQGAPTDTIDLVFSSGSVLARGRRQRAVARYGEPLELDGVRFVVLGAPRAQSATWLVLSREAAIDAVLNNLKVRPRPQTDVVDVSYTAFRPRIAQAVVNSIVELYRMRDVDASRELARRRRVFLQGQLLESDSALSDAQLTLGAFRRRAQLYSSRDKLTAQHADLTSLDSQRSILLANRQMIGSLLTQLRASSPAEVSVSLGALMASPGLAADPAMSTLYRQLSELRVQRDSLTTGAWRNPPSDPVVRRLDDLIATTHSHIEQAIRGHLAGLDARIASLDGLRAATAAVIDGLPGLESEELRLLQRVAAVQTMTDQLRVEFQRARVGEAVEVGGVTIVDRAALPYQLAGMPRRLQIVLGALIGLLLGAGLAIVLEVSNTSLRHREEIEAVLHIPSLAVIPRVPDGELAHTSNRLAGFLGSMHRGSDARSAGLVKSADVRSIGAEAYRILRTNLLFSSSAQGLRTLVVTSALAQEGKTVIAANLAISFAREGLRVLLVDCDLRCPRLHLLLGGTRSPGLAQVLAHTASATDATRATPIPGLSFLPCGSVPANPSDLLRGGRLRELLASLADGYDMVILDTPPVLPVADALILAALSDGVVMVVRAGKTTRTLTQEACARLGAVGANVVGTVLNDPSGHNDARSYSYPKEYAASIAAPAGRA